MTKIDSVIGKYLKGMSRVDEDAGTDAVNVLQKAIKFYDKIKDPDDKQKEVIKFMDDLLGYYKENMSFSPGQAKAIYNISMGIKKMTGKA